MRRDLEWVSGIRWKKKNPSIYLPLFPPEIPSYLCCQPRLLLTKTCHKQFCTGCGNCSHGFLLLNLHFFWAVWSLMAFLRVSVIGFRSVLKALGVITSIGAPPTSSGSWVFHSVMASRGSAHPSPLAIHELVTDVRASPELKAIRKRHRLLHNSGK